MTSNHIKGFLKNAGKVLNGKTERGIRNLRSKVNDLVFVQPRFIKINTPEGSYIDYLERPLRAETTQGPRVALARSEMLPEGSSVKFNLAVIPGDISEDVLRELFDYGFRMGIGQFRNGDYGQFIYELEKQEED